jgi:hypothetical protein
MLKTLFITCLAVLVAGTACAQLDTVWVNTYGGPANDGFRSAIPVGDRGVVAVGYTYSFGAADANVYAVRTDADGDTLWMRAFGGDGMDYGYDVCQSEDGGYVITGFTTSFGAGAEDVYVVKIDSTGNTLWSRTYGGSAPDEGYSIYATGDGHYIISGRTDSYGSGYNDVYLLKLDSAGDTVWTRVYGDSLYDWGQSVCGTGDGNYGICGAKWGDSDNLDIYVLKVSPAGTLLWENTYGGTGSVDPDIGTWVVADGDTGLVASAIRGIEGKDPLEACMLWVDLDGGQLAYRKAAYSYYQYANSVCLVPEGGYLLCGSDKAPDTQKNDLMLLKRVTGTGWAWQQIIGGPGSDWGSSVVPVGAGYYLISGHTESFGAGGFDGWLLMMKEPLAGAMGAREIGTGLRLAAPTPNPSGPTSTLKYAVPAVMDVRIAVYDVSGRRVALLTEGKHQPGDYACVWSGRDDAGREVEPGIYYARLAGDTGSATRKIVMLRK